MNIKELKEKGYVNTNQMYANLEIRKSETKLALIKVIGEDREIYTEGDLHIKRKIDETNNEAL